MAVTVQQTESLPAAYPVIEPLSEKAAERDAAAIWQRLEAYMAHRFTPRDVIWLVEGEGSWRAPLTPAVITAVEVWERGGWTPTEPPLSPFGGYDLLGEGPYRITANVGGGPVPAAVQEAFRRLAEYSAVIGEERGALHGHGASTSHSGEVGEAIKTSMTRPSAWAAKALQLSGAADLLRPYRRA